MFAKVIDITNGTEDAQFEIDLILNGTARNYMDFYPGEIGFNQDAQDIDFRVESDNNTHMLFVDAGNDRVGIGAASPDVLLEVAGAHTSSIGMLHLDSSDHAFISLDAASSSHDKGIYFQEAGTAQAIIDHDGSANQLRIHDGSNTHMVITDAGKVGIGTTSPTDELELKGDTYRLSVHSADQLLATLGNWGNSLSLIHI